MRTGYDESLDAPWREEARKQFVEVVNEHVAKRSPWVKTADRLPTENDADGFGYVLAWCSCVEWMEITAREVMESPNAYPYWMPRRRCRDMTE